MPRWVKMTALELLLAERLRRAETLEETSDEKVRSEVVAAIQSRFVVTRSRRHCVRLTDVMKAGLRAPRARRPLVGSVIAELGGIIARPRNRSMVNGFRHAEHSDLEGVAYAKSLRHDPWSDTNAEYKRKWDAAWAERRGQEKRRR
jgi:hypothetical protein